VDEGVGTDTIENVSPLLYYDSSSSLAPSNVLCPLPLLHSLASPQIAAAVQALAKPDKNKSSILNDKQVDNCTSIS
jgi:hypothetical protein